jgi:formylglycine-generating enzyme required for sulfatase activity
VCRGGSWGNGAGYCRVAIRGNILPGYRDSSLGFRAAFVPQSSG